MIHSALNSSQSKLVPFIKNSSIKFLHYDKVPSFSSLSKSNSMNSLPDDDIFYYVSNSPSDSSLKSTYQDERNISYKSTSSNSLNNEDTSIYGAPVDYLNNRISSVPLRSLSVLERDQCKCWLNKGLNVKDKSKPAVSQPIGIPSTFNESKHPNLIKQCPSYFIPPHELSESTFEPSSVHNSNQKQMNTAQKMRTIVFEQTGFLSECSLADAMITRQNL